MEPKRLETEASAGHHVISPNCSPPLDLNFPLPGEKGPACLVKVRDGEVMSRAGLSVRQAESALHWFVGTEMCLESRILFPEIITFFLFTNTVVLFSSAAFELLESLSSIY